LRGSGAKGIWRVGALHSFVQQPNTDDASYSAKKSKPQFSGVTGAHAKSSRRARAPGRTDMLARAMGITCVEDLPDHDHMVW